VALYLVGMPNPFFWGIVAGLLNFAPYVGPLVTTALLTLASITHFDTLSSALLAPGIFLFLTSLEGQFITPAIVGRRLSIIPTAVFISVVIWTWLWGIAGALMAAPILAAAKILCENIPALRGVSQLVSQSRPK
jgi:predicted PurR-regulated permease PerM